MMLRQKGRGLLGSLFGFSQGERRGVLWLLPLLAIVGILLATLRRPSDLEPPAVAEEQADSVVGKLEASAPTVEEDTTAGKLFPFDPNTVTFQELCRLGFDKRTAAGIIKYRVRGKRFEIPEDFATCYGVSVEAFTRLQPYIVIGERYRARPAQYDSSAEDDAVERGGSARSVREAELDSLFRFDPDTMSAAGFVSLGFSPAQAAVIVNYRESLGGFRSAEDFEACYVVSERKFRELLPHMVIRERADSLDGELPQLLELNGADSAALVAVHGIGEVLAGRILEYRRRLGGFARVEQLCEIRGMTERNYEWIVQQIWVDSCVIRKIDINFATPKELVQRLGEHPYASGPILRKILKQRQLKGGWSTVGEMVKEHILSEEEAARLSPYLLFRDK